MFVLVRFFREGHQQRRALVKLLEVEIQITSNHRMNLCLKGLLGQIFVSFVFRFLTYLLSCILFFRSGILFITLPLSCAVCKFRYNLSPRPYFIASFFFPLRGY